MIQRSCPHCRRPLPGRLFWKTLFAGQTPHACPSCRRKFRLTYRAKQLIAYGNVAMVLVLGGLLVLPDIARNLLLYAGFVALVISLLPLLARYEKAVRPYD
jgi:CXXC-20-CXXC protein